MCLGLSMHKYHSKKIKKTTLKGRFWTKKEAMQQLPKGIPPFSWNLPERRENDAGVGGFPPLPGSILGPGSYPSTKAALSLFSMANVFVMMMMMKKRNAVTSQPCSSVYSASSSPPSPIPATSVGAAKDPRSGIWEWLEPAQRRRRILSSRAEILDLTLREPPSVPQIFQYN